MAVAACGGTESPGPPVRDAGVSVSHDAGFERDGGITRTPTVAFVSDVRGTRVNRIVYGEPISVRAEGLVPGGRYQLSARLWGYVSQVEMVAEDGTIDTARDAPVNGTYEGVSPDGLIWSMLEQTDAPEPTFDVSLTVARDGEDPLSIRLVREPMGLRGTREVINDGVVGTLYVPDGVVNPPVVIVLGGSGGGVPEFTAAYLSTFGVASLALGYFGANGLPNDLARIPVEVVDDAIVWLQAQNDLDATRVALWGGSRGSELALMAGTSTAVKMVIVEAPSDVRWASVDRQDVAAWTRQGIDLPYMPVPPGAGPTTEFVMGNLAYRFTPMFEAALDAATPVELEAAEIDVAAIDGPVILIGGAADALWPSCRFGQRAMDRLIASGHAAQYDDEVHCFEDAGHGFGPSGWPTASNHLSYSAALQGYLLLGGTPGGTAHAQREIYSILERVLARL